MCYLLELDGCKILMDCGWTYSFDTELIEPLTRYAYLRFVVLVLFWRFRW